MNHIKSFITLAMAMVLSSCHGVLDDIYDTPAAATSTNGWGFVELCTSSTPGLIKLNTTSYTRWTYIDFHNSRIDTLETTDPEPAQWDIAIHRYDCKTNGGKVAMTGATSLQSLSQMFAVADSDYTADIWTENQVIVDMSGMMNGVIGYTPSMYNEVLSSWLNVDMSTMPPAYIPSGRVYLIRLSDGTQAGIQFVSYTNESGVKGYLNIEYIYPFNP